MSSRILWPAALAGVVVLSSAAGAVTLAGRVTDTGDGQPLPGAIVRLDGVMRGTYTDPEGMFRLAGLPAGRQILVTSHIGYQTRTDTLNLQPGGEYQLDLTLQPTAIRLGQTEVRANRSPSPAASQAGALSLSAAQLRQAPAVGEPDVVRSLTLVPGVKAASDYSSGLYVRGGSPDQNLVLLDGAPVYNPSHAFGFFSTFNPDAVNSVTLYKSAYPASYGGNLGALLDVSTQSPTPPTVTGSAGLSLLAGRVAAAGPWAGGSWKVAARRTYLDPILATSRAGGAAVPDYYFYDLNARLDRPLAGQGSLAVASYLGSDYLDFSFDPNNRLGIRWRNRTLAATWKRVYSPALLASLILTGSHYQSDTDLDVLGTPVRFTNSVADLAGRVQFDYAGHPDHAPAAGLQFNIYRLAYAQYFATPKPDIDLHQAPAQAALFLQDQWRPTALTELTLGVRASSFSEGRRGDLCPRLALRHMLRPELAFKLAAGTSVQYLQLVSAEGFSGADFWLPLDGSVRPSRARQAALGFDWEPLPAFRLTAEAYHTRMADLVLLDYQAGVNNQDTRSAALFFTGGRGRAAGIELMLEKRTGDLSGWLGYTLGRTRRWFAELNGGQGFAPKYDRRHDLSAVLAWRRGIWTWEATFVYGTGQAYTPAAARYTLRNPATGQPTDYVLPAARNSARLLPYHRLDLGLRRQFGWLGGQAALAAQLVNAYNRRNEWFVQYDTERPDTRPRLYRMLPILPSLGLEIRF